MQRGCADVSTQKQRLVRLLVDLVADVLADWDASLTDADEANPSEVPPHTDNV